MGYYNRVSGQALSSPAEIVRPGEGVSIRIDPSSGTDEAPLYITTQALADAHGPFATIGGFWRALPDTVWFNVQILLADGAHSLTMTDIAELSRFHWGQGRMITPTSRETGFFVIEAENGLVVAPGSIESAVSSESGVPSSVVLTADPGYGADAYQDTWLGVNSGTGVGQFKAVRAHAGTAWECAGRFSPGLDGTSRVQPYVPAASITVVPERPIFRGNGPMGENFGVVFRTVDFNLTDLPCIWQNLTVFFDTYCRYLDGLVTLNYAEFRTSETIYTKIGGLGINHFTVGPGSFLRTTLGTAGANYWRNENAGEIILNCTAQGTQCGAFILGAQQFDGPVGAVMRARGGLARLEVESNSGEVVQHDGVSEGSTSAVQIQNGGQFVCAPGDLASLATDFNGGTNDTLLDNVSTTWAAVDADPNDRLVGVKGSQVFARI